MRWISFRSSSFPPIIGWIITPVLKKLIATLSKLSTKIQTQRKNTPLWDDHVLLGRSAGGKSTLYIGYDKWWNILTQRNNTLLWDDHVLFGRPTSGNLHYQCFNHNSLINGVSLRMSCLGNQPDVNLHYHWFLLKYQFSMWVWQWPIPYFGENRGRCSNTSCSPNASITLMKHLDYNYSTVVKSMF